MEESAEESGMLDRGDGIALAWRRMAGRGPTVVFLPGFYSNMTGEKPEALAAFCAVRGQAFLRLEYSGHGTSGGRFEEGTIGRWRDDALFLIDRLTEGPLLLVGSSMGGWIALLVALARTDRVAGLLGIAAAPDFTETLMWEAMAPPERALLERERVMHVPGRYGETVPIALGLIEEGRDHLLLRGRIPLRCPVRLLHGQQDPDVPWETALKLASALESDDVRVTLVKDGEHRLSRPQDLALLRGTVAALLGPFLGEDGA